MRKAIKEFFPAVFFLAMSGLWGSFGVKMFFSLPGWQGWIILLGCVLLVAGWMTCLICYMAAWRREVQEKTQPETAETRYECEILGSCPSYPNAEGVKRCLTDIIVEGTSRGKVGMKENCPYTIRVPMPEKYPMPEYSRLFTGKRSGKSFMQFEAFERECEEGKDTLYAHNNWVAMSRHMYDELQFRTAGSSGAQERRRPACMDGLKELLAWVDKEMHGGAVVAKAREILEEQEKYK